MKCKKCRYFTGTQCHGHGEFYGECILLQLCKKELIENEKADYISTNMNDICNDDTECKIKQKFEWKSKKI